MLQAHIIMKTIIPIRNLEKGKEMDKKLGEIIKVARKNKRLTQGELAQALGVKQALVSKWERNERFPQGEIFIHLMQFLDIVPNLFPGYIKAQKIEQQVNEYAKAEQVEQLHREMEELKKKVGDVIIQTANHHTERRGTARI